MRNRPSRQGIKGSETEIERKEGPRPSGAYIRNLVKQLSSSRTKDPTNPKVPVAGDDDDEDGFPEYWTKLGQGLSETQKQSNQPQEPDEQKPQPPKKQVSRRLHTSRPYRERLLNMAEARREIVTALKFHRAAMKQANIERQQQQLEPPPQIQIPRPSLEHAEKMKYWRSSRVYPSNTNNHYYSNHIAYSSLPFPLQA
ncbi:hypothetical protein NE237_024522 [Protea cynaroides]|uniref:Uncharacterized protein n=1 Tax=Protea cynaroides TaxID=273540 RepID=A0A9Q0H021_9MAGN|nr:hypothetical protein NE237_024522 [Protea cynaroides]